MRPLTLALMLVPAMGVVGQPPTEATQGQFVISEEIGLAMNRSQVLTAVQEAWSVSFGQEPGAQVTLVDPDNGLMEGNARMNYRSKLLMGREETMGVVSYQVTILARNGQCHIRVHDLRHAGNRAAKGGGVNAGLIMDGAAPAEHYEGFGLSASRRMHADIREAVSVRLKEALRRFSARLRLLGGG